MAHRIGGRKLSRPTDHRLAMYRNLVRDLLRYEKIVTTEAKAKEIRGMAEHIITLGKRGQLPARRQALRLLPDGKTIGKVFGELAPRYGDRTGGYTRTVRLGRRLGDGALLVQLELLTETG